MKKIGDRNTPRLTRSKQRNKKFVQFGDDEREKERRRFTFISDEREETRSTFGEEVIYIHRLLGWKQEFFREKFCARQGTRGKDAARSDPSIWSLFSPKGLDSADRSLNFPLNRRVKPVL